MYIITSETNWIALQLRQLSWDILHKKRYKCYDLINHKFYISKDVTFQKNEPYFKESEKKVNELDLSNIFIYPQINCSGHNDTEMINEDECETGEVTQTQEEESELSQV
jgi:hypothetical protein